MTQLIQQVNGDKLGCFVKLSCRSPKDLTFTSPKVIDIYEQLIKEKKEPSQNEKVKIKNHQKIVYF